MLHPNILGYSFGTKCGIQIYSDIYSCPFYDIRSSMFFVCETKGFLELIFFVKKKANMHTKELFWTKGQNNPLPTSKALRVSLKLDRIAGRKL